MQHRMSMRLNQSSLQWAKDRIIESGAESWARPLWMKLTGKQPDSFDVELTEVMARVLQPDSTCIDIGAHKGVVIDTFMRFAPQGTFHAFEPLPYLAKLLARKYRGNPRVIVQQLALADKAGSTTFYIDKAAMGFSGLRAPRDGDGGNIEIETCTVKLASLDELLPEARPDVIKIDVEGAELGVLRGALKLLARARPVVIFEHGQLATRFGTTPEDVYDVLAGVGMQVSLLPRYLASEPGLSRSEFCDEFHSQLNYNFIAYPRPANFAGKG